MTVQVQSNRIQYNGNGVTVAFAYPYLFQAAADLVVVKTSAAGVDTTLVLTTDYTVAGAGNPAGGTVTMIVAPATGEKLTIYGDPQVSQQIDLVDNGPFPAEVFEAGLDKLTLLERRTRDLVTRSMRLPDSDGAISLVLPTAVNRANKFVGFDANGLLNVGPGTGTATDALNVNYLATPVGSVTRTVKARLEDMRSALDFGAVGDDATNNDAAAAAIVSYINANGGYVYWPAGKYRFNSPIPNITALGGGFIGQRPWVNAKGTQFRHNAASGNLITLAAASSFLIRDIGFVPVPYKTAGAEIRLQGGCQATVIEGCRFDFTNMPIDIGDATWTTIRDCVSLYNVGVAHVRTLGQGTGNQVADGVVIDNLITGSGDNPSFSNIKGNWAVTTVYALGDFVIANGSIWKCTQAGTSAGAGTGPNAATAGYATSEAPFITDITDNTAKWRFQCNQNAAGVLIDSHSLYVKLLHCDINSGVFGVLVSDSVASSSEPKHVTMKDTFIDHVYQDCVHLAAGQGVFILNPLFSAAAAGRGIYAPSSGTFKGELAVIGGQIYSHATEGLYIEETTAAHIRLQGAVFGGNSLKTANTYDAIKFASGVTHFQVIGCKARPMIDAFGTQRYGIDIGASCDYYSIIGNDVQGNGTGGINGAATGANRIVAFNPGAVNFEQPGLSLIERKVAASQATLDFTIGLDSTFDAYVFVGYLKPATDDVALWCRVDANGGASFDAGASDYKWTNTGRVSGGTAIALDSDADTKMVLTGDAGATLAPGNANAEGTRFELWLFGTDVGKPHFNWKASWWAASDKIGHNDGGGARAADIVLNAVQFLYESGNIASGAVELYGLRKA